MWLPHIKSDLDGSQVPEIEYERRRLLVLARIDAIRGVTKSWDGSPPWAPRPISP